MLERIIFAIRESPDWEALARDHRAGRPIDPARYAAPRGIPSFPADIRTLIARWNVFSRVDFFECRRQLKDIAAGLLRGVEHATIIPHSELSELGDPPFLLFFCDDDDWFAPDLFNTLAGLDLEGIDAAVFPLVRFELNSFTLTPGGAPARLAVGPCHPFVLRYHTNNYALTPRACARAPLTTLLEHRAASEAADRLGFVDRTFDVVISATNKSPCSASLLAGVVADSDTFRGYVGEYLVRLKRLAIPPGLAWMSPPLWQTIRLFESLLPRGGRRRG